MRFIGNRGVVWAVAGMVSLACPGLLPAQAPPGPISLPESAQPHADPAARQPAKPVVHENNPTIFGSWRLNRDESEDARQKLQAAQQANGGGSRTRVGVGGPGGGVGWPGGGGGGGYPGGGGGGGYGRRPDYSDADLALMADMMNPSYNLTVTDKKKDNEVELYDEQDRKRAVYTDGRKVQKSASDAARDVAGKWDGDRLVATEDGPHKGSIERILSPMDGGEQLYETFKMLDSKGNATVTVRYVYDRVQGQEQPRH